ncbi:hypothetical protein FB45DRAFT_880207 [Roridomyces roridus]|uniref:Uncharacterized protein n=1 Tax=Roridomyces roridus TaxID=1738132 RepID=A0AAD7AYT1_9AGAR|nr:hypothetical protein FB45DRAFT_880207 [Roridomyces roridus]
MARKVGRPPLDPVEKERRLKKSKKDYEERNHDNRLRKARERMQRSPNPSRKRARDAQNPITHFKAKRKAAGHSESYRDRKFAEEKAEACRAKHEQSVRNELSRSELLAKHLPARTVRAALTMPSSFPLRSNHTVHHSDAQHPRSLSAIATSDSEDEFLTDEFQQDGAGGFPSRPSHPDAEVIQIQPSHTRRFHHRREPRKQAQHDDVPHGWDPDVIHTLPPSRASTDDTVERVARIRTRAKAAADARRSADDKLVKLLKAGPEGRTKRNIQACKGNEEGWEGCLDLEEVSRVS